jgi:hypothetical protein
MRFVGPEKNTNMNTKTNQWRSQTWLNDGSDLESMGSMFFRKRILAFRIFANELSQTNFRTLGLKTYPRRFFLSFKS